MLVYLAASEVVIVELEAGVGHERRFSDEEIAVLLGFSREIRSNSTELVLTGNYFY